MRWAGKVVLHSETSFGRARENGQGMTERSEGDTSPPARPRVATWVPWPTGLNGIRRSGIYVVGQLGSDALTGSEGQAAWRGTRTVSLGVA